jgi:hypothetical protein
MINLLYSTSGQARRFSMAAVEVAFAATETAPVATDWNIGQSLFVNR